jgi:hypothetical protein
MLLVKKTEKTKKTPTRCRRGAGTVHMPESKGNRGNKKNIISAVLDQGCQMVYPKIQIWVNFEGSCSGRCWYILWTLGPFYGLLLYFMDIWYSSWKFGVFSPFGYLVKEKSGNPVLDLTLYKVEHICWQSKRRNESFRQNRKPRFFSGLNSRQLASKSAVRAIHVLVLRFLSKSRMATSVTNC